MVQHIDSAELRKMDFKELKKHAKELRRNGYDIKGYTSLSDNPSDMKLLRKMIRNAQKSKSTSKSKTCKTGLKNITDCQKNTSAKKVREIAEKCKIDTKKHNTKVKMCKELIRINGKSDKSSKSSKPEKVTDKHTDSDEYKKMKKHTKKELQDKAKKLKIDYGSQDGEIILVNKLRKHELIVAILNSDKTNKTKIEKKEQKEQKDLDSFNTLKKNWLIKQIKKLNNTNNADLEKLNIKELEEMVLMLENERELDEKEAKEKTISYIASITNEDPNELRLRDLNYLLGMARALEDMETDEDKQKDEDEAREKLIKYISSITGQDPKDLHNETLNELIEISRALEDMEKMEEEKKDEKTEEEGEAGEEEEEGEEEEKEDSDDEDSDEEEKDDSDEEEKDDSDEDKLEEGTEIIDIDNMISNVISDSNNISQLSKSRKAVLKCMGLLS